MSLPGKPELITAAEVIQSLAEKHEALRSYSNFEDCKVAALMALLERLTNSTLIASARSVQYERENLELGFTPDKLINPADLLYQYEFGDVPVHFWCHFYSAPAAKRKFDVITSDFTFAFDDDQGDYWSGSALGVVLDRRAVKKMLDLTPIGRAPSVKVARPPSDEAILAKADEMKARGHNGQAIAKLMRHQEGFENVATTEVLRLIHGRWPPGRPPKKTRH